MTTCLRRQGSQIRAEPRSGDKAKLILSGAPISRCYNYEMQSSSPRLGSDNGVDRSLVEWFLSLTPEQRLDELESRVGFLLILRSANESQLSRDT